MELIEQIKKDLKEMLSEKRYIHSVGVMETCEKLAQIYNENVEEAKLAGLLHDIAKEMSEEEALKYIQENKIGISKTEEIEPKVLHGKIGADIAVKKYNVNKNIENAIKYHTTTNPEMNTLAKIVFVADKIEPTRPSNAYIETERKLAETNLDMVMVMILDKTINKLLINSRAINIETIETRNKILTENCK